MSRVAAHASAPPEAEEKSLRAPARGRSFVEALRRGDTAALELAFRAYGDDLRFFARGYTRTDHEADDVVQEVFLQLPDRLDTYRGGCDLWTWLRMMARCEALERKRGERRRTAREGRWSLSGRQHERPEPVLERIALERALTGLPAEYRSVLVLREVHGLSHREIAARLEISENLSGVRLSRARRRLRELL